MLHTQQLHQTQARVTPARQKSASAKRDHSSGGARGAEKTIPTVNGQGLIQRSSSQHNFEPYRASLRSKPIQQVNKAEALISALKRSNSSPNTTSNSRTRQTRKSSSKENASSTLTMPTIQKPPQTVAIDLRNYTLKEESKRQLNQNVSRKMQTIEELLPSQETFSTVQSAVCPDQTNYFMDLATKIFKKAAKKYGARLSHRQVDSVIRKSEFSAQVDRVTRKYLKSILLTYERNGNDAIKAVKLEVVKQQCSQLARQHYQRTLLSKGMFVFMRLMINAQRRDPTIYYNRSQMSCASALNTTLGRMLEGLVSQSKQSQLDEFIEIEKTLETEISETLTSEPEMCSNKKPPLVQKSTGSFSQKPFLNSNPQTLNNTHGSGMKHLSGIQSPSVQDLQGEFMAFCEEGGVCNLESTVKNGEPNMSKTFLQSTLGLSQVAIEQQLTGNNKDASVHFFLGQDGTLGGAGMSPNKTHLKIAQLFKTTGHSVAGNDTQSSIAEQLARLKQDSAQLDPFKSQDMTGKQDEDNMMLMADYMRNKQLIQKAFFVILKHRKADKPRSTSRKVRTRNQTFNEPIKAKKRASSSTFKDKALKAAKGLNIRHKSPVTTKTKNRATSAARKSKTSDDEIPVKEEVVNAPAPKAEKKLSFTESQLTAPKFQSCMSSPQRLQSILTDSKSQQNIFNSHQTSRRTQQPSRKVSPNSHHPTEQWQSQDSRQLHITEQNGIRLRQKFLKRQALKHLEINVTLLRQKEVKADQFVQKRVIGSLRHLMYGKGRDHRIQELYEQSRCERLIAQSFRNWRGLYFENQIAAQCRRQALLKQGFHGLLQGTTQAQQTRQISMVCKQHFEGKLLKRIVADWGQRAKYHRSFRKTCKYAIQQMHQYRQTKILKGWFNQIDLLKNEQAVQSHLLQTRGKRLKRHYFVAWLTNYVETAKKRTRIEKLSNLSQENFARRFFSPWLNLAKYRMEKRQRFFQMRAKNLVTNAFLGLRQNVYNSNGERKRARKVLLLRATRLIKTAFYNGLLAYCEQKGFSKETSEQAQNHRMNQLVAKSIIAWKSHTVRSRKAKIIEQKRNFISGSKLFLEWQWISKHIKKAKKMRSKVLVEKQFHVLKALYEHASTSKVHKSIISHCLNKYSQRLLRSSLYGLADKKQSMQAKRDIMLQIDDYYIRKLKSKVILGMGQFNFYQRAETQMINDFQVGQEDKKVWNAFKKLQRYKIHRQFMRSYIPYLENRKVYTKEQCFLALKDWKENRQTTKQKLTSYQDYRQGQVLENAFENLVMHAQNSRFKKANLAKAVSFNRSTLLFKGIDTLLMHKVCKSNQRQLIGDVEKIRRKSMFISWFNMVHNQLPNTKKADNFYIQNKFTAFKELAVRNRGERAKRLLLKQLSAEYYPYMLKKRGVCKWRKISERSNYVQERLDTFRKLKLRKIFNEWWNNGEKICQSKERHIMQIELNKRFQYRRVLTALSLYVEDKSHQREIINIFQTKHNMLEKARVFSALVSQSYEDKITARKFFETMLPRFQSQVQDAFTTWKTNLYVARNEDKAGLFQENRAVKFYLRRYFDKLRIRATQNLGKGMKSDWLDQIKTNSLKRQCFNSLMLFTKEKVKKNHAWMLAGFRSEQRLKHCVFNALATKSYNKRRLGDIQSTILNAFNKIRSQKVMMALQQHTARSVKAKLVTAKWGLKIKDKFLSRWQDQMFKASKLNRLSQILQEQNHLKFMQAFMLKLDDASYYMQLKKKIDAKEKAKALQGLKQHWLLGKMAKSLSKRYLQELQRKALMAFKYNQLNKINLREQVLQQADIQNDEDNFDMLKTCFNQLKQNRFLSKATRIARGTFGLNILKKAFTAMTNFTIKQKLLQVGQQEMVLMKKHRCFQKWLTEFDKGVKGQEANAIINFDRLHLVMQAWKKYTHDEKLVKQFRAQTSEKALKLSVIQGLQKNLVIENFQRMMFLRIKERQDEELKRDAFSGLCAAVRLKKIQSNMRMYYLHKFQKKTIKGWRTVTQRNNKKRLDLIKQRAAFLNRPYLAKPLLAMRNLLMFRAFRSIMLNANKRKEFKFNKQICTYSIYLRLQRKAFYALRLNAAQRFQKKKSKEIKRLMIQRRWFTYLQRVTQSQKLKRKQQTDAAIFRFLSLQRRGVVQWVSFISKMKRVKIKRTYALTLYYNRVCDKVFTALKVNAAVKARKRRDISQATGYITTDSSEIMHEASFTHRNKLHINSMQQFVNSSTTNLRKELEACNQHSGLGTAVTLSNLGNPSAQNLSPREQYYQADEPRYQQVNSEPAVLSDQNRQGREEQHEFKSRNGQQQQHNQQQQQYFENFYQQPIDQVERLNINVASQDQIYSESLIQQDYGQPLGSHTQQKTVIYQSLPSPLNHLQQPDSFNFGKNNTNDHQFSGELGQQHQQLTLGTVPERLMMSSEQQYNNQGESFQTQQWIQSYQQNQCQLCEEGVIHEHTNDSRVRVSSHEHLNSDARNNYYEAIQDSGAKLVYSNDQTQKGVIVQSDPNVSTEYQYIAEPQRSYSGQKYDHSNVTQSQQAMYEQHFEKVQSPHDGHQKQQQFNEEPAERDYPNHHRQASSRYAQSEQQEEEVMNEYGQEELGEMIIQDYDPQQASIERRVQLNISDINVIHSTYSSKISTPDILLPYRQQVNVREANVPQNDLGSQNDAYMSMQSKMNSQPYSHQSSLKTTPGVVRGKAPQNNQKQAKQQRGYEF